MAEKLVKAKIIVAEAESAENLMDFGEVMKISQKAWIVNSKAT